MVTEDGEVKLLMTTSNDRVDDVIKYVTENQPNPKIDLYVTEPATGNRLYIEWVKKQTITRAAAEAALANGELNNNDDDEE